jgi:hypothetical protein
MSCVSTLLQRLAVAHLKTADVEINGRNACTLTCRPDPTPPHIVATQDP